MQAVLRWLTESKFSVADMQDHVRQLQQYFLEQLRTGAMPWLSAEDLQGDPLGTPHGRFLSFHTERAASLHAALTAAGIVTDFRGSFLRFGFAIYHDPSDVDELIRRMQDAR